MYLVTITLLYFSAIKLTNPVEWWLLPLLILRKITLLTDFSSSGGAT